MAEEKESDMVRVELRLKKETVSLIEDWRSANRDESGKMLSRNAAIDRIVKLFVGGER